MQSTRGWGPLQHAKPDSGTSTLPPIRPLCAYRIQTLHPRSAHLSALKTSQGQGVDTKYEMQLSVSVLSTVRAKSPDFVPPTFFTDSGPLTESKAEDASVTCQYKFSVSCISRFPAGGVPITRVQRGTAGVQQFGGSVTPSNHWVFYYFNAFMGTAPCEGESPDSAGGSSLLQCTVDGKSRVHIFLKPKIKLHFNIIFMKFDIKI